MIQAIEEDFHLKQEDGLINIKVSIIRQLRSEVNSKELGGW